MEAEAAAITVRGEYDDPADLRHARSGWPGAGGQLLKAPETPSAMDIPTHFSGGCACGAIRFECSSAPLAMVNCHCRDCQLAGGTAFAPNVMVMRDAVQVTGEPRTHEAAADSQSTSTRSFCGTCGTPLFASTSARPTALGIRAGALDDSSWYRATMDIWTDRALAWQELDPTTKKFGTNPVRSRG